MSFSSNDFSHVQSITLDLASLDASVWVRAKQWDQESRFLAISITKEQQPFSLPSDVTARFRCSKPDGTAIFNDAVVENQTVYLTLSDQTLAVPGLAVADLVLYQGDAVLSTASFYLKIEPAAVQPNSITSSDEFNALTQALTETTSATETANQALTVAEQAIEYIQTAEDGLTATIEQAQTLQNSLAEIAEEAVDSVSDLSDTLSEGSAQISSIETAVAQGTQAVSRLSTALSDAQTTISSLDTALDQAEEAVESIETAADSIETATATITETVAQAQTTTEAINTAISNSDGIASAINSAIANSTGIATDINSAISNSTGIATAINSAITNSDGIATEISTATQTASTTLTALEEANETAEGLVESLGDFGDVGDLSGLDGINEELSELKEWVGYQEEDILGVEVDFPNCTITRIAGAVGKTAGVGYDVLQAYGGRRRCNLSSSGVVNAYYGEEGYSETGSNGDVMVEQPAFYYRVLPLELEPIEDGKGFHLTKARYYISDIPRTGFTLHPAFIRSGVSYPYAYFSAYDCCLYDVSAGDYNKVNGQVANFSNDKLGSIKDAKAITGTTQSLTLTNARSLAAHKGTGWTVQTIQSISATQLLFLIEFASFNIQDSLGNGPTTTTSAGILSGKTSIIGNMSGAVENAVSYRGEENLFGNVWRLVDGATINPNGTNELFLADDNFVSGKMTGNYQSANLTMATANGYISTFAYSPTADWVFFPSATEGDSTVPVGDSFYQANTDTTPQILVYGGYSSSSTGAGLFYQGAFCTPTSSSTYTGCRIAYLPE